MDIDGTWAEGEATKVGGSKKKSREVLKYLNREIFPPSSTLQTFMAKQENAVLDQWERPLMAVRTKDYYLQFEFVARFWPKKAT